MTGPTHTTYFDTNEVHVDNGLTLGLSQSAYGTTQGAYAISVPKFSGTFYVQVQAQMEDSTQGQWPAIWLIAPNESGCDEIDMHEGGFLDDETGAPAGTPTNDNYAPNYHAPNCTTQGVTMAPGFSWNTDLTGSNVYGMELNTSAQTIKWYLNGNLAATENGNISTGANWEIILWNAAASCSGPGNASGYHTCGPIASGDNPMTVSEVQVYS